MLPENPLPCWRCGKTPEIDPNGGYPQVVCYDCYDGAEDSGRRCEMGAGLNREQAVADWNEKMAELADEHRAPLATPRGEG